MQTGFIHIYVNTQNILGMAIRPMDDDSENQSVLKYINFASHEDGVTEEFCFSGMVPLPTKNSNTNDQLETV